MEQVTKRFTVKHATITYPDQRTESVEFVEKFDNGHNVQLIDISDDAWRASYLDWNDEASLDYDYLSRDIRWLSAYNIESIEVDWVQDLIAVAEVAVIEDRDPRLIRSDNVEYSVEPEDPDVTIWERAEWEAHQND